MKGFILSSKPVSDDLKSLFGDVHPSSLPVGGSTLNDLQRSFLSSYCDEVYTLVSGRQDVNANEIIVESLSLVETFRFCMNLFPDDFIVMLYGDTLFDGDIPKNKEFITVNKLDYYYNWLRIADENVFSGMISVDARLRHRFDNVHSLKEFIEILSIDEGKRLDSLTWLDFGSYASYFKNKRMLFQIRAHNDLIIKGNSLVKSSTDVFQLYAQFKWLKEFESEFNVNVPRVKEFEVFDKGARYTIEYKPLPSLSELYVFTKGNDLIIDRSLGILRDLTKRWSQTVEVAALNYPLEKFLKRRPAIEAILSLHMTDKVTLANILDRVESIAENWPKEVCYGHGDLCFSNVLFDNRSELIYLIDPRGYFGKEASTLVPLNYDLFKIAHSYLGNYDQIIFNRFSSENFQSDFDLRMQKLTETFGLSSKDFAEGVLYLFVTLLPLHTDRKDRIESFIEVIKYCNRWLSFH